MSVTEERNEIVEAFINEFDAQRACDLENGPTMDQDDDAWVSDDCCVALINKDIEKYGTIVFDDLEFADTVEMGTEAHDGNLYEVYRIHTDDQTHFVQTDYADRLTNLINCGGFHLHAATYVDTRYAYCPIAIDLGDYWGVVAPLALD